MDVASALFVHSRDRTVLVAQRKPPPTRCPLMWEFPGGKLETGETGAQAIVREMQEELGLEIEVDRDPLARAEFHTDVFLSVSLYVVRSPSRPEKSQRLPFNRHDERTRGVEGQLLRWVDLRRAFYELAFVPSMYLFYDKVRELL